MAFLPFPEWLPDLPALGNPGCTVARNVVPAVNGYRPIPALATYSVALEARCQGAFFAVDPDGNVIGIAGTATNLRRLEGTSWTYVSRATNSYALAADGMWKFARFGRDIIATNIADPVQGRSFGGTTFVNHITSASPPRARYVAPVRGLFLMLANLDESGTFTPNKVRWSAINDSKDFAASQTTQSDSRTLESSQGGGGAIQGLVGYEYALVFQERAIWRGEYVGTPDIFSFSEIELDRGAWAPNSIVSVGRDVYYLSEDGFRVTNGVTSRPIGEQRINRTFFNELVTNHKHRIVGAYDTERRCVMWCYTTADSAGNGDPDRILIYHPETDRFSFAVVDTQLLVRSTTVGYTLDGLDAVNTSIDALAFSLDSRVWTGGNPQFSAFDRSNRLAHFTGTAMTAILETSELQNDQGQRSMVLGVRPMVTGAPTGLTVQAGRRDLQANSHTYSTSVSLHSRTGIAPVRQDARYHRFRVNIVGGFTDAMGADIDAVPSGEA